MNLETASSLILASLAARQPTWLWGAPGIGKSELVRDVAGAAGLDLIDVRAVLLDPVDLRGLPHVNGDGRAHWCPPAFLPFDRDSRGVLFLDELAQAPPLVLSACLQLVLDRRLGEYVLPDGWAIIAASNRQEDRAAAHRVPTPLLNRFLHVDVDVDPEAWQRWAIANDIDAGVRSFIRYRPALLHDFDPQRAQAARAFPSPRSWVHLSRLNPSPALRYHAAAGLVGEGAAAELCGYLEIVEKLPPLDTILKDPSKATVPTEPAVLYAIAGALAAHCKGRKPDACDPVIQYAVRMPDEYAVLTMRDCITSAPGLELRPAAQSWIKEHLDVFLGR